MAAAFEDTVATAFEDTVAAAEPTGVHRGLGRRGGATAFASRFARPPEESRGARRSAVSSGYPNSQKSSLKIVEDVWGVRAEPGCTGVRAELGSAPR